MSINILHVSDLHFVTEADKDKTRYCDSFEEEFIDEFKDVKIDYLIITGDIADKSKEMEYVSASKFLNKVVSKLQLPKKNVLICMGNHDIFWRKLEDIADKEGTKDLHLRKDKYINFEKFYNDFYNEGGTQIQQFKTDSIFAEIIDDSHRIMFLGVNTCYQESNQDKDHYGCVDKGNFENYIRNIDAKYRNYLKCLVMHHNPKDLANENHSFINWRETVCDVHKILGSPFIVFCGHIHSSDGESEIKSDEGDTVHYISAGSLLQKKTKGKYNLYTINDDSSKLEIKYVDYEEDTDKHYWQDQSKKKSIKEVILHSVVRETDAWKDLSSDYSEKIKQELKYPQDRDRQEANKSDNTKKSILDEIRDHQLYYSGHFHWDTDKKGENSKFRSHGYIDINYLVSHIESLESITKLFKDKIEEIQAKTVFNNVLMVSIGLECNVVGARLSVLFPDFKYSYIPRKREVNDHNDIENKIGFSEYNTVILIKDITFDAEEVIELIEERFPKKIIHLISLFYCGKKKQKKDIFNGLENVHFYSLIDDIEIPRCDLPESECPIIKNKLQTIYRC